ncbi:hypothetical protein VDGD_02854 [Verticillium dahliae]|nr:hypothetical protein VDGD_02854 [Verticillium dahliae]
MATILPPPSKRQRREELERTTIQQDVTAVAPGEDGSFKARFVDGDGKQLAEVIEVPLADASEKNLSLLVNTLLDKDREDYLPYRFRINIPNSEIIVDTWPANFLELLRSHGVTNPFETTVTLTAEPQAVFKVQAVSRMAHRIPGHGQAILAAQFSPATSSRLATGSGDNSVRIWNTETGTPQHTMTGHTGWTLCVAWSPDAKIIASGSMDKTIRLWDPEKGVARGGALTGHQKWITQIGTLGRTDPHILSFSLRLTSAQHGSRTSCGRTARRDSHRRARTAPFASGSPTRARRSMSSRATAPA